jgi:hypothetical protein
MCTNAIMQIKVAAEPMYIRMLEGGGGGGGGAIKKFGSAGRS